MSSIHTRIKQARLDKRMTLSELGEAVGVSAQAAQQWENEKGGTIPRPNRLHSIAKALGVTDAWLQLGESLIPAAGGILPDDEVDVSLTHKEIPMYDIQLSAGNGNANWVILENENPLVFRNGWFVAKRLSPSSLRAMRVKGNSMTPFLENMDTVVIDIDDTEIIDDEIYAVVYKEKFFIKKIRQTGDGVLLISSNPDYDPILVKTEEADKFQILGKKVWRGG